jgi:cytochrome c oxidase subunit IV
MAQEPYREQVAETEHAVHEHPGPRKYLLIMIILGVLTALEVAAYETAALKQVLVPILLVLTTAKFALVVMFYMHLKFDSRIFSWVFVAPLILAVSVVVSLIILLQWLPIFS